MAILDGYVTEGKQCEQILKFVVTFSMDIMSVT